MNVLILGKGVSGQGAKELAEILGDTCTLAVDGDKILWEKFDLCVTSPGFAMDSELIQNAGKHGLKIISEMEYGFLHYPGKILAVTGTNGKTTTTELTCALLESVGIEAACAGNIGLPLSSLCAEILSGRKSKNTLAVVEVSSFQLEHIDKFSPHAACFTNLASDHLNRYNDSLAEYRAVKMRIFNGVPAERRFFGASLQKNVSSLIKIRNNFIYYKGTEIADYKDCKLKGQHNLENIECALNLVSTILDENQMLSLQLADTLKNFRAGHHRIEEFEVIFNGRKLTAVDDSKATNPHSVVAACKTFAPPHKQLHIILGGLDKDMDFSELLPCVPYFAKCYLIGEAEDKLYEILSPHIECQKFGKNFKLCCQTMKNNAAEGDILILSPACASMDMFKNYAERGDIFKENMLDLNQ
ncbi:MAG: UDP-N-acetylmuramoyl-L-alanine--D-glutamate ligase [Lentisphaeria bacterium]|nr:UDP-N-acetylmuramoyl-L-alanine--D-glutamate ligase [Lentisphaeria bacterium]